MPDPLAAFAREVIDAIATEAGIDPDALGDLAASQQRLVWEFPDVTVEAPVQDWRAALPEDPLVGIDATAYCLSVRESVRADVVGRLDLSADEREAFRLVNARQFERAAEEPADRTAVILTK